MNRLLTHECRVLHLMSNVKDNKDDDAIILALGIVGEKFKLLNRTL